MSPLVVTEGKDSCLSLSMTRKDGDDAWLSNLLDEELIFEVIKFS